MPSGGSTHVTWSINGVKVTPLGDKGFEEKSNAMPIDVEMLLVCRMACSSAAQTAVMLGCAGEFDLLEQSRCSNSCAKLVCKPSIPEGKAAGITRYLHSDQLSVVGTTL